MKKIVQVGLMLVITFGLLMGPVKLSQSKSVRARAAGTVHPVVIVPERNPCGWAPGGSNG